MRLHGTRAKSRFLLVIIKQKDEALWDVLMEFKIMDTQKYFDMFLGIKLCVVSTHKKKKEDEMCEILSLSWRETLEGEKEI